MGPLFKLSALRHVGVFAPTALAVLMEHPGIVTLK
jgi:hypothetical protein